MTSSELPHHLYRIRPVGKLVKCPLITSSELPHHLQKKPIGSTSSLARDLAMCLCAVVRGRRGPTSLACVLLCRVSTSPPPGQGSRLTFDRPPGPRARDCPHHTDSLTYPLCVSAQLNYSVKHNYPAPALVGGLSAVLPSGVAGEAGIAASAAA